MENTKNLERARELLAEGRQVEALRRFELAFEEDPEDAEAMSYYGLLGALERGQVRGGLDLARKALEVEPNREDLYLNLARIQVKARQKAAAVETLRAGLRVAPRAPALRDLIRTLGARRRPFFPFLRRGHVLNKYLGLLLTRIRRASD